MVQLVAELIFSVAVSCVYIVVVPGDSILHSVINSPLHISWSDTLITCEVSVDR